MKRSRESQQGKDGRYFWLRAMWKGRERLLKSEPLERKHQAHNFIRLVIHNSMHVSSLEDNQWSR